MIPAIGAIAGEWSVGKVGHLGGAETAIGGAPTGAAKGGFGAALSNAVSALEQSQQAAGGAETALATGTASDPEAVVTTVENAQLAMEMAAQLRNKATEAVQTIFQTQM